MSDALTHGANYSVVYAVADCPALGLDDCLVTVSSALGGYILSSCADDAMGLTVLSGSMSDDVVGEVPDKAG